MNGGYKWQIFDRVWLLCPNECKVAGEIKFAGTASYSLHWSSLCLAFQPFTFEQRLKGNSWCLLASAAINVIVKTLRFLTFRFPEHWHHQQQKMRLLAPLIMVSLKKDKKKIERKNFLWFQTWLGTQQTASQETSSYCSRWRSLDFTKFLTFLICLGFSHGKYFFVPLFPEVHLAYSTVDI